MKSQMTSDYTFPKPGFFSDHSYVHTVANPKADERPQPKRYDPRQNTHENIAWVKPDHNPYESSYHAAFNQKAASEKVKGRITDPEFYPQRNLSNTLIPKTWPTETKRRLVSHHETGIDSRDFREVAMPSHKQFANPKYVDNMADTTLAFSPATEKYLSPATNRSRSPINKKKNAAEILKTIYVNRSDLAEHIRENHEDVHMQRENHANRQLFKEDFQQYNKVFQGRAGTSSINDRLQTVQPRNKQERRDVSSTALRPLMDHAYLNEKDYTQVNKDFKYAYVAPCHTRHPVTGKFYGQNGGDRGRETFDRIMNESTRHATPDYGRKGKSESRVRNVNDIATPINVSRLIRKHRH